MYIYMKFALKIGSFFCKVIVGYKMKIKGVIEDLKFKKNLNDNSKNISRTFSGAVAGSVGVSLVSDSSLFQLILLKIYRPLPM